MHLLNNSTNRPKNYFLILYAVAGLILWFSTFGPILLKSMDSPISDRLAFRQAQTAISSYYMLQNGFQIDYETPVFGPPWKIPFEFPTYQLIVAAFAKTTSLGLDLSGRIISICFFLGCLYPIWCILGQLKVKKEVRIIGLAFFLTSPMYVFWARTFMIETCALFLSLMSVKYALKFIHTEKGNSLILVTASAFAILAGATKITTLFPAVGFTVLCLVAYRLTDRKKPIINAFKLRDLLVLLFFAILPVITTKIWIHHTDILKSESAFSLADFIVSKALNQWNFGTIDLRLSAELWQRFYTYGLEYILGRGWLAGIFGILAILSPRKLIYPIIAFVAFCAGPFVFANLYYVHDYYWVANGVYLLFAITLIINNAIEDYGIRATLTVGILYITCLLSSISTFKQVHRASIKVADAHAFLDASEMIKNVTGKDDILFIMGDDWDSRIPYYSERRAIMLRGGAMFSSEVKEGLNNELKDTEVYFVFYGAENNESTIREILSFYGSEKNPIITNSTFSVYSLRENQNDEIMQLELHAQSSAEGFFQIYIDNGKGYSESRSIEVPIINTQSADHYKFPIALEKIQRLRIDPPNEPSKTIIYSIELTENGQPIEAFQAQDLQPSHQARIESNATFPVKITSTGNDPRLELSIRPSD